MSVLLMLVILGLFIPSSQAIKCYSCSKSLSVDCDDPFTDSDTCSGNVCAKGKHIISGRLTIVFFPLTSLLSMVIAYSQKHA